MKSKPKTQKEYICPEKEPGCEGKFYKINSLQQHCTNIKCCLKKVNRNKEKKAKKERALTKLQKIAAKSRGDWIKDAQKEVNAFIRLRDDHLPCISCGVYHPKKTYSMRGGVWDAGHWLGRGAYPELRFEELNIHKQCKSCNSPGSSYKAVEVAKQYRINLIEKIGIEKVEWLEGPHDMPQLTIDELKGLIVKYRLKVKELKASADRASIWG